MSNFSPKIAQRRIYLIGFMGSGKSHLALILAKALPNWLFFDTDAYIQHNEKKTIAEIIATQGEPHFRRLERDALQISTYLTNAVIATGGGLPCFGDNMQEIQRVGLSVFLNPPIGTIYKRLSKPENAIIRPLWQARSEAERRDFLYQTFLQRYPIYSQADIQHDSSSSHTWLLERLKRYFK
jgi:shikimate kinase